MEMIKTFVTLHQYMERIQTFWILHGKDKNILDPYMKGSKHFGPTWMDTTWKG